MSRLFRPVSVAVVAAFVCSLFASFILPAATPQATAQGAGIPGSYIVVLKPEVPDVGATAQSLARQHGGTVTHVYEVVLGGFAIRLPNAQALEALRKNPNVLFADVDQQVFAFQGAAGVTSSGATIPTGVDRVGADGTTGAGSAVAIIDSGIASHPDLNIAGGYNCTTSDTRAWSDGNGHGTHVAGTVGANGGVVGVAPGTPLYAMKVLDSTGSGSWSWVICGINEAARLGISVANMSLGGASTESATSCLSSSLHKAICDATAKGMRFAVAAGNNSADAGGYVPAKYPEVTTVSALADSDGCTGAKGASTGYGADDSRASFSNYGSVVDIAAPGTNIYSTVPGGYGTKSGTSMASPHVAGLMALGGYSTEKSAFGEAIANYPGGNIACVGAVPTPTAKATTAPSPTPTATATTAPSPTPTATTAPSPTPTATTVPTPTPTTAPNPTLAPTLTPVPSPTPPTPPTAPTGVIAEAKGPAIVVTWTDNATNETVYRVYRSVDSGTTWTLVSGDLPAGTTKFRDTGVTSGTSYVYKVVVCNTAGLCTESGQSPPATAK